MEITFMKICSTGCSEILCAGTGDGRVFLFDVNHLILRCIKSKVSLQNRRRSSQVCTDTNDLSGCLISVIDVKKYIFAIEIIDQPSDKILVAISSGLSGISFFVIDMKERVLIVSGFLPTPDHTHTISFMSQEDETNRSTLVYGTIEGYLTSVEITYSDTDFHIFYLDSQFIGQSIGMITPLIASDFMPVPEFELLNLIFQENTKRSILYGTVMDTWIIDGQLPDPQNSSRLGSGVFTNSIPVPVTDFKMRSLEGIEMDVKLRFTSFDKEGLISSGNLIVGNDLYNSNVIINRIDSRPRDRVFVGKRDGIDHFYLVGPNANNYSDIFLSDDTETYMKLWEEGFPVISNINESSSPSESRITFKYNPSEENHAENDAKLKMNRHSAIPAMSTHPNDNISRLHPKQPLIINVDVERLSNAQRDPYMGTRMFKLVQSNFAEEDPAANSDILYGHPIEKFCGSHRIEDDNRQIKAVPYENVITTNNNGRYYIDRERHADMTVHNHAAKVENLIKIRQSGKNPCPSLSDYLLVTGEDKVVLIKQYPLIVTSFTVGEMFPLEEMSLCDNAGGLDDINMIKFTCHMRELNCVAVASQAGLVSLMRLTEYKGILSFRQEYILGWRTQDPNDPVPGDGCVTHSIFGDPVPDFDECDEDYLTLPLYHITGMDYTYIPPDEATGTRGHAILFVDTIHNMHTFEIYAGDANGR